MPIVVVLTKVPISSQEKAELVPPPPPPQPQTLLSRLPGRYDHERATITVRCSLPLAVRDSP